MRNIVPPVAITCGDPAGIGPEIIQRWAAQIGDCSDFRFIGPFDWVAQFGELGVGVGDTWFRCTPGAPCTSGARIALKAMEVAAEGCLQGTYRAVVTGPVSKAALAGVGFSFPGQTEFFANAWSGQPVMAFAGQRMRVVLATWHRPLMSVGPFLRANPGSIERAVAAAAQLVGSANGSAEHNQSAARIAVCGLNPHAGEEGILGSEERDWLNPLLDKLRLKYGGLSSALPGDTVFF